MIVELKPVERAQAIDEGIERAAGDIFDAAARTTDRVMVVPLIAGHEGRLTAVVEAQRRLAFRCKAFERPIDGRARDRRARFLKPHAELAGRKEAGLGPQDASDRLPWPGLVFGLHSRGILRTSLKILRSGGKCGKRRCLTGLVADA